jgi:hypothetical protein
VAIDPPHVDGGFGRECVQGLPRGELLVAKRFWSLPRPWIHERGGAEASAFRTRSAHSLGDGQFPEVDPHQRQTETGQVTWASVSAGTTVPPRVAMDGRGVRYRPSLPESALLCQA